MHATLAAHRFTATAVALSPDGKTLATGGENGKIKLWSIAAGQELVTLAGHNGSVLALVFDPAGGTLASGGTDGTVRVWRAPGNDKIIMKPGA